MTAIADTAVPVSADREYAGRNLKPLTALRAFRRLIADKEDTAQVFEIMRALTGRSTPNGYARLLRTPGGGEIAFQRAELAPLFSDAAWLDGFAPGTVGAAYREFMRSENLSAEGLAGESRKVEPYIDAPHVYAWYARRMRDIHDVWHVLTGYGRDALGEACVVAFSHAQTRNLGFGFIAVGAAREIEREAPGVPALKAIWEAWRHGRRAAWLPGLDYAALFAEPLETARTRLNIAPPRVYEGVPADVRTALKLRADKPAC
jgi:ubiquinone biosynthesis protein COQ4